MMCYLAIERQAAVTEAAEKTRPNDEFSGPQEIGFPCPSAAAFLLLQNFWRLSKYQKSTWDLYATWGAQQPVHLRTFTLRQQKCNLYRVLLVLERLKGNKLTRTIFNSPRTSLSGYAIPLGFYAQCSRIRMNCIRIATNGCTCPNRCHHLRLVTPGPYVFKYQSCLTIRS